MRSPPVSADEIRSQTAQLLPSRETLCYFGCANVVSIVGINVSLAVNAASINASANALAAQYIGAAQ